MLSYSAKPQAASRRLILSIDDRNGKVIRGEVVGEYAGAVAVDQAGMKSRRRDCTAADEIGRIYVQRWDDVGVNGRGNELNQIVAEGLSSIVAEHAAGVDIASEKDHFRNATIGKELL